MLSIKNMSFKGKLLLYAASATGTALALCCVAVMTAEWIESRREVTRYLGIQAEMIGMNASAALTFDDRASAEESLRGLKADENIIRACICSRDGTEFAKYTRAGSEDATKEPVELGGHRFSGNRLHLRHPIVLDGEQIGSIYLQYDLRDFYGNLKALAAILEISMVVALVGAALISSRVQRVLTRPVTELANTAQAVAKNNDYSVRAVKHSADELGTLTDIFNDMLAEIEQRDAALQDSHNTLEQQVRERTATLAQRERQQAAVAGLGQQALRGEDLTQLCVRAAELVAETLEVEYAKVLELPPDGEALLLRAGFGWKEGLVGQGTVGADRDSQAGYTLLANEPVIVEDLRGEARFTGPPLLLEHDMINGMSVVIMGKDRPYGVLGAQTTQRRKFSRDDMHFLQAVANVLSEAIQRRSAEEGLSKLSVAVEQSPASVMITDTQGTIEYVNPRFCEVTGYTAEEAIGQNARILKGGKKPDASYKELWDTILAGKVWTGAFENRKKNGELYWEEASICPIRDAGGAIRHFLAVKQDITERKEAERALQEAHDKLEQRVEERTWELVKASQAKSEFLATMSHELRTPLNGVIAMNELLLGTKLDDKQRRHAWLAKTSGDTLLALINDILDFSKIEAGKIELECIDLDLQHVMEQATVSLASKARGKNLELICVVHPNVPRRVRGDPGRLQQVLLNLINNGIKFTERGEVVIRATAESESESHATVRITVTDTGIGIPPARRDRLFQSFSQIDSSTTRIYGGTGLGLAICKQLVELMGGQIGFESEPGRASTFWFELKLEKQAAGVASARIIPDELRRIRILVVDDNSTEREILREQLQYAGLECQTAADDEQALAKLHEARVAETPFGLAIIGMQMQETHGTELARTIKADPSLHDTVLMLLTSTANCDEVEELKSLGFAGLLSKPVRQSELPGAIVEAVISAGADSSSIRRDLEIPFSATAANPLKTRTRGARILVAEDNEIGQEVAVAILDQAGYDCDVVSDGKQAVEAALTGKYNVILMDCQMPEMDGYEATRLIRKRGGARASSGGQPAPIPIVALTANALKGDRERCLEAGMDDYVTKPLDAERLIQVIESLLDSEDNSMADPQAQPNGAREPALEADGPANQSAPIPPAAFDYDALLKRWGGKRDFADMLIAKFREQAPAEVEKLEQSISAGDAEETMHVAHGLKGAAGYVAAESIREFAARLEEMGRAGNLSGAESCLSQLKSAVCRCIDYSQDTSTDTTANANA